MRTFIDRSDVENVGRRYLEVEEDDAGTRAWQLNRFWLYVDPDDHGYSKHALGDGFWEAWITLWMDKNVPEGVRCLDIGANHGYYSHFLATKGHQVEAWEPQPRLVELILKSAAYNDLPVWTFKAAIADKFDKTNMMVPIHHGMNATISNQHSYAPDGYENITVETTTLDKIDRDFGFIKVDAEGAEDLIWAGSIEYRKKYPNTLWLMEWRWDRYKNPEEFGKELLDNYEVTHVNTDGNEEPIWSIDHLASKQNEDWMLVLRSKSE